jgi:peroxiredoxin
MAHVTLKGNPIHTFGEPPKVGNPGPDFRLTRGDLSDLSLTGFEGTGEILNIVPRLDTGVGAASARRFEKEAGDRGNVVVLRQLGLLQDTGDEDLQMLKRGSTLNCRGLETRRIQAVFELDRPW